MKKNINWQKKIIPYCLKTIRAFAIIGLMFIILMPFVEIFINSIKGSGDTEANLVFWIPENPTLSKIRFALRQLMSDNVYFNTFFLCTVTSLLQVIVTALFGYTFARLKFKGSNILFGIVLFTMFVPKETLEVGRKLLMSDYPFFGVYLFQSNKGIFLMTLFGMGYLSPLFIYLFRQYFRSVSKEIEEQASIDGASTFKIFYKIMLPNAKGAIITTFIMTFVWTYNDSYYPRLFNYSSNNFLLLSTKLSNGRFSNVSTTALLIIVPLLIIYLFVQKQFINSIEKTIMY